MSIICAIADINAHDYDVILPTDIVEDLHKLPVITVPIATVEVQNTEISSENVTDENLDREAAQNVDGLFTSTLFSDVEALIKEQRDDVKSAHCWTLAHEDKGGCVISHELLYHNDKVKGQTVSVMCSRMSA